MFERDPELLDAFLAHKRTAEGLQRLYRIRLGHALDAARALMRTDVARSDAELLEIEREQAIDDVRRMDAQHLDRLRRLNDTFEREWRPSERSSLAHHRGEVQAILERCGTICIAGGHVLVLVNRLRLFDFLGLTGERNIVCWSAGAMALSDRSSSSTTVHRRARETPRSCSKGIGRFEGILPLPHAKRRLRLEDPVRVGLFARRFDPSVCAALDEGARIDWDGKAWSAAPGTRRLAQTAASSKELLSRKPRDAFHKRARGEARPAPR